MTMHKMALLEKKVKKLRAANAKQKRKQKRGHMYVAQESALRVEEDLDCI